MVRVTREREREGQGERQRDREKDGQRGRERERLFSWPALFSLHVHTGNAINKPPSWDVEKTLQVLFLAIVVNYVTDKRTLKPYF